MDEVAKKLGYSSQTSTPFYRRIAAARLFNLIEGKASLTKAMVDYIQPDDEEMKSRVLTNAVQNISAYSDLLVRYADKKLNVDLVKNAIAKEHKLTEGCRLISQRHLSPPCDSRGLCQ